MRVFGIVVYSALGLLLIFLGIKAGFIDQIIWQGSGRSGGTEYTGLGAMLYGVFLIAAGCGAIYFGFKAHQWDEPNPRLPEMKGWRLNLYKLMRALMWP